MSNIKQYCESCIYDRPEYLTKCNTCSYKYDEIPTNYYPKVIPLVSKEHMTLLNALATIMEICEEHIMEEGGCADICPFRRPEWEQLEGIGQCAFESPSAPVDWKLIEPTTDEEYPILLETDYCINEEEENEEDDTIMHHIAQHISLADDEP